MPVIPLWFAWRGGCFTCLTTTPVWPQRAVAIKCATAAAVRTVAPQPENFEPDMLLTDQSPMLHRDHLLTGLQNDTASMRLIGTVRWGVATCTMGAGRWCRLRGG